MSVHLLFKSLVLGLSIAAPVGPIGILCIRRSIVEGRAAGLVCGLGAATADAVYGALGGFALTSLSAWLVSGRVWMTAGGSAFLLYLGVKTFRSSAAPTPSAGSATGAYFSTFLLTLANPLTILSFTAAFAGMGAAAVGYSGVATMLAGVFAGSALWWLMLTAVAGAARGRLTPAVFATINRVSGMILLGFGLYTLAGLLNLGWT
ncbi:MAG: LysE family transporter [Proteobacteria bacterium]|nr:LysE family transporter [Pseudomonadota bacterium]